MSYMASSSGYIDILTTEENFSEISIDVKIILEEAFTRVSVSKSRPLSIDVDDWSNYHEDDVKFALTEINEKYHITSGEIEFSGEDNSFWRFIYKNGDWYEENGWVTYEGSPSHLIAAPQWKVIEE